MPPRIELAKRRASLGYSQEKLAELMGVNRSSIVRWEAGRPLYARQLAPLAEHLQVTALQLQDLLANRPFTQSDSRLETAPNLLGLRLTDPLDPQTPAIEDMSPHSVLQLIDQLAAIENKTGPASVLPVVQAQQDQVAKLLSGAAKFVPGARYAASRFAEFQGWLHHDLGELDLAMHWTNMALDLAMADSNDELAAYIWQRKSNIASDANQSELAITFAKSVNQYATSMTPKMRAVAERQEAFAHALNGNEYECSALIEAAHQSVSEGSDRGDEIAAYCSESYIEMESANAWIELGRHADAIPVLESADQQWPNHYRRDHGLCKARLSLAYAGNEQPAEAVQKAEEGIALIEATGSERALHYVRRTVHQLKIIGAAEEADGLTTRLPLAS